MPSNLIQTSTGEMGDPVSMKARRSHDRQAASATGLGPTQQPGVPELPMHGARKNGNFAKSLGGEASPRIARKRGSR